MELTIMVDAQFSLLKDSEIENMKNVFHVQIKKSSDDQQTIQVWLSLARELVADVDSTIQGFLRRLLTCGFDTEAENTLRVAVFYNLDETIVFPFSASASTIKLLAECGMSIELVGYPCSSDEPQPDEVSS